MSVEVKQLGYKMIYLAYKKAILVFVLCCKCKQWTAKKVVRIQSKKEGG